ncbi:MAG: hypothetical protein DMD35_19235 [Gemmatimonadetes bacterium]|nr:MAG: hypothetical protein DMD35_19235 [Gemmatimonadota bacterium]
MAAVHLEIGESALILFPAARASRSRVSPALVAVALFSAFAAPAVARAQTPTSPPAPTASTAPDSLSPDSLAARLARAEAAIAALRQQLATESQSTVHTRSRLQLDLTGRILSNFFLTLGRVNNVDVPGTALAPSTVPEDDAFGVTVRQSRLGAIVSVDGVLGGSFIGDFEMDFFGGVQNGPGDRRLFPEPRMRTTTARLRWPRTDVMVGIETPLVSGLSPVSLAASGVPLFSAAGNLWNWLGQLRLTQEVATTAVGKSAVRWAVQGALMTPYAAAQSPTEPDVVDAGERSHRPAFEARLRARWGDSLASGATDASIGDGGGEIGVGVHRGWVADGTGQLITSYATALDARVSFAPWLELRGEAYTGRLLRGLGGGAIGQAFGRPLTGTGLGPPISDHAGWAQLNARVHPTLLAGTGCGVDVADEDDRPTRRRNGVCAGHLLWRPSEPVVVGLEYRRIATEFDPGVTSRAQHLNLSVGFEL